jgi:hypothetical protein
MQIARRRQTLFEDLQNSENELKKLRASRESQPAAPGQPQQNIPPAPATGSFFRISFFPEPIGTVAEL